MQSGNSPVIRERKYKAQHWVAAGQAKQILHEKNRAMIELVDGRRLPVSRPYFRDAKKLIGGNHDAGTYLYRGTTIK